jgi:hypothetical protein
MAAGQSGKKEIFDQQRLKYHLRGLHFYLIKMDALFWGCFVCCLTILVIEWYDSRVSGSKFIVRANGVLDRFSPWGLWARMGIRVQNVRW